MSDKPDKEELAKQYNCQPSDIDIKVTQEENITTTTVTISAPVNIENFNM